MVSVIIPVYNRESTIKRAIDSVLNQTYRNIELIVVDDGSTDSTMNILRQVEGEKIIIIGQDHKGANAARNLGIENAKGEYIAFQDSDDEWMPEKLEKQIAYMIANEHEACYCAFYMCGKDGHNIIPSNYLDKERLEKGLANVLKDGNVVSTQTLVINQNIVAEIGMFDEDMPRLQDYEYVLRIIRKKQIGYVDEPLVRVHYSADSISNDDEKLEEAYYMLYRKHGDFLNIDILLKECLQSDSIEFHEREFYEKIQRINDCLGKYPKYEKVVIHKAIIDMLCSRYMQLSHFNRKEYEMRVEGLRSGEFAIYGAGDLGKRIFFELSKKNLKPKFFLVTRNENGGELYDVPIIELRQCDEKNLEIIIGISIERQYELIKNLIDLGYKNYFRYPGFC